ncbi:hypothetical protein MINS_05160 [Mycolicibacterium insubricum]|nr:hypothetical protein MINS_05160 [Mycolicibacterium insubricum]
MLLIHKVSDVGHAKTPGGESVCRLRTVGALDDTDQQLPQRFQARSLTRLTRRPWVGKRFCPLPLCRYRRAMSGDTASGLSATNGW